MNNWKWTLFLCVAVAGCSKDKELSEAEQLAHDITAIDTYLKDKGVTAQQDDTGLRYVIITEGTGQVPSLFNTITVKYTGKLLSDESIFDQAVTPVSFKLSQLIRGWQIAFPKFPTGTKATLYIPSGLGYGTNGNGLIPPNANLIFDVELIDVK
jgi:FKBP-type peptidyl-prolyl cis-trans isomerase FkpA